MVIDVLQPHGLAVTEKLVVSRPNVIKKVNVRNDILTFAPAEMLSKLFGTEGDLNPDETVLREPVVVNQTL